MSRRRSPSEADLFAELPPISYVWQMPIRRPRPAEWDIPDGARSGRLTPAMRAKLERIVKRAPEVMVKITGRTKSVGHLKSHLEYITRNGELAGETEQGALLVGRVGLKDLQSRWADDAALDDRRRRDGSLSVNIILSMPAGTDAAAVKDAARAFAIETFGHNHDYRLRPASRGQAPARPFDGSFARPRREAPQSPQGGSASLARAVRRGAEAAGDRGGGDAAAHAGKSAEGGPRRGAGFAQARRYSLCRSASARRGPLGGAERKERRASLGETNSGASGGDPPELSQLRRGTGALGFIHRPRACAGNP